MIEIKDVNKIYKTKDVSTYALRDINLDFNDKGCVFILGISGSGKTTLLNVIGGLDKIDSGNVIINGKDINTYSNIELDKYRNNNVGFIFQSYNLVEHLTIYENICLPLRITKTSINEIKKRADELIKKLNLEKERNKYPNQVSGGQAQRACIARALINNPKIILADEPTGALDTKNSKIVMDILKEISKERLVIIVSHNEDLAYKYALEIIRLKDGEVEIIEKGINESEIVDIKKEKKSSFKFLSLVASIKLSFKNMLSKKIRTIFTILATSIGILSTCLVLMVSNSMSNYTEYAQKQALGSYPITITSNVTSIEDIEEDNNDYEAYPSNNIINITNEYQSYYSHVNVFDNDYLEYVKNLDSSLYTVIDYGNSINMHILSKNNNGYEYLSSSSYIKCMNEDSSYITNEYELLYGDNYPSNMYEVALVIDKYNCIDAYVLDYLGIDYKDKETYTFEEICNKEFKVVTNDLYYKYVDTKERYVYNNDLESAYNDAKITLKISCILRAKDTSITKLYNTGILYTQALRDYVHNDCINSEIVIKQLNYGLSKNVFTNKEYTDSISDFSTVTAKYQYESCLKSLGYYYNISYIKIYTSKFENRNLINEYLKAYNIDKDDSKQVIYRDYMGTITEEFEKFVKILMNVLIIFSSISLVVSSIMIALLMYVSVVERTKEIGILRCIGYSKPNISFIFITEASFIGACSGLIGVGLAFVTIKPILRFVSKVVTETYSSTFDISTITNANLSFVSILLIILASTIISILASLIPAFIASTKEPVKAIRFQGE